MSFVNTGAGNVAFLPVYGTFAITGIRVNHYYSTVAIITTFSVINGKYNTIL